MLERAEVERLANEIRALLMDAQSGLSRDARRRWEGAVTSLEVVLGERPSLPEPDSSGCARDGTDFVAAHPDVFRPPEHALDRGAQ